MNHFLHFDLLGLRDAAGSVGVVSAFLCSGLHVDLGHTGLTSRCELVLHGHRLLVQVAEGGFYWVSTRLVKIILHYAIMEVRIIPSARLNHG